MAEIQPVSWQAAPKNLSESGIHNDDAARRLGFAGGFVPGVALYAHVVAALLAQDVDWLREGRVSYRFRKPVYDGENVQFAITETGFVIHGIGDERDVRASGSFDVSDAAPEVDRRDPVTPERAPMGDPAQVGAPLRTEFTPSPERIEAALRLSGDFDWREGERTLLPVGLWLNPVELLLSHFDAPVTIHHSGRVWHHAPAYAGETIVRRGSITSFEERKGNSLVHFLVALESADGRLLATVEHTSVYALARAREAVG